MKHKHKKEEQNEQEQQAAAKAAPAEPSAADGVNAAQAEPAAAAQAELPPPLPTQLPQLHPAEEKLLRLKADFDNLRRRFDRERQDMVTRSNERLIKELIPVLDHLELALASAASHKTDAAVLNGFRMVYDQMCATLAAFGVKTLDAQGKTFDPNLHEAISQQPSNEVPEHGVILQTRRGYVLGERLLRPAQVIVSAGPPQPPPETVAASSASTEQTTTETVSKE